MDKLILPDWPMPAGVKACSTTRHGGISASPYDSLNLGTHVGDITTNVVANRQRLVEQAGLPQMPVWLEQVHGTRVLHLDGKAVSDVQADAVYSRVARASLCGDDCRLSTRAILLISGDEVAAAHAGWRGLCAGVLEQTLVQFNAAPSSIIAWLGPAIGPQQFEVGEDVKQAFSDIDVQSAAAFIPSIPSGSKYLADIYSLARLRLQAAGIHAVYGGDHCTVSEKQQFFSYRRDGITGRMASLVWLI